MPRLRNTQSGAIVSVTDDKAARLGGDWEPADKPEPKKTSARKTAAAKKTDSD